MEDDARYVTGSLKKSNPTEAAGSHQKQPRATPLWQSFGSRPQPYRMAELKMSDFPKDLVRPAGLETATSWFVVVSRK